MKNIWNIVWYRTNSIFIIIIIIWLYPIAISQTKLEKLILEKTNIERIKYNLKPLSWDNKAANAARKHASDMLNRGYFSHQTPEGTNVADRMRRAGLLEVGVGENIAYYEGYTLEDAATKVVADWMNSPHHKENILRPGFTHLGVGLFQKNKQIMIVQDFLSRPFEVLVWQTPSRSLMNIIEYEGSSQATIGIFVDGLLNKVLHPPNWAGELRILSGSEISLGLWRNNKYFLGCTFKPPKLECPNPKIKWRARYQQISVDTSLLQITLPRGQYTLAYGLEKPTAFKEVNASVVVEVPVDWGAIWVGVPSGARVEYTHKILLFR